RISRFSSESCALSRYPHSFPTRRSSDLFMANAVLNGMIVGVALLGIAYAFRQVLLLRGEIAYLERLKQESSGGLVFPGGAGDLRSEEHTSELQSREKLVCRLLLEKKKTY